MITEFIKEHKKICIIILILIIILVLVLINKKSSVQTVSEDEAFTEAVKSLEGENPGDTELNDTESMTYSDIIYGEE